MPEKLSQWYRANPLRAIACLVLAVFCSTCGLSVGGLVLLDNVAPAVPAKVAPHILGSFVPVAPGQTAGAGYINGGNITTNAGVFTPFILGKEPIIPVGQIDAGACTTLYLDPSQVAVGEKIADDALVIISNPGDQNIGTWVEKLEFIGAGSATANSLVTVDGGTTGIVSYGPYYSPSLIDASAAWQVADSGGGGAFLLTLQICAPASTTVSADVSLSAVHKLAQSQGSSTTVLNGNPDASYVLQPYPTTIPTIIDGGYTLTLVSTYGAMSPATGATFSNGTLSFSCSTFTVVNEHLSTCTLANGILDAGSNDASLTIALTSPMNPAPCPGCVKLGNASPPPVLPALAAPYWTVAAGGGPAVTLPCTSGCSGATLVTVGSATAVPSASSPTSVTFQFPANTASSTAYSITVTGTGGVSNTLSSAAFYWPSTTAELWYAPEFLTVSTSAWIDLVGSNTTSLRVGHSEVAGTLTGSWSNGLPAFTLAGNTALVASFTQATNWTMFVVGNITTANGPVIVDGLSGFAQLAAGSTNTNLNGFSNGHNLSSTLGPMSSPCLMEFSCTGSAMLVRLNNGTATTLGSSCAAIPTGLTFGAANANTANNLSGNIFSVAVLAEGFSGSSSSGNEVIANGIVSNTLPAIP